MGKSVILFNLKNIIPQAFYVGLDDAIKALFSCSNSRCIFGFILENSLSYTHCHLLFLSSQVPHTTNRLFLLLAQQFQPSCFFPNNQTQGVELQNIDQQRFQGLKTVSRIWRFCGLLPEPHQRVRRDKNAVCRSQKHINALYHL